MSASLTQLAYQALRDIGNLRPGQTTSTDVLNDIRTEANQMLDLWQLDELMAYCYPAQSFPLNGSQQQYTIGPNETLPNWNAQRPTLIRDANLILTTVSPVIRIPMAIINVDRWSDIAIQNLPQALPLALYYEKSFDETTGASKIFIWPGDLNSDLIELFTSQTMPFVSFADLTTVYNFPPGYERMIRKNLAVAIKPMMTLYSKLGRIDWQVNEAAFAEVKQQALESKEAVQSDNAPDPEMRSDPAYLGSNRGRGNFNYLLGTTGRYFR